MQPATGSKTESSTPTAQIIVDSALSQHAKRDCTRQCRYAEPTPGEPLAEIAMQRVSLSSRSPTAYISLPQV
jgi:hypothetical protein